MHNSFKIKTDTEVNIVDSIRHAVQIMPANDAAASNSSNLRGGGEPGGEGCTLLVNYPAQ